MTPNMLNFITGNANKLAEVKAILGDTVRLTNQAVDLPEIQGTIDEVSRTKCRSAADVVRVESSSLYEVFSAKASNDRSKAQYL